MLIKENKKEPAIPVAAGFFGSMNVKEASDGDVEVEKENVLNTISTIDFDLLKPDDLKLYGERVATAILEKINEAAERIALAKSRSKSAAEMKTGMFGKTGEKVKANSKAIEATNEALHEMNELMRAIIVYTQLNGKLSKVMNSAMARMMAEGFKNHSGDLVELNKNGEEFAQVVMQEAEDFASRQLEIELLQQKQAEAIKSVEVGSDQKARVLAKQIVELQKKREAHVAGIQSDLTARIQGNMARIESTMNRSDENDALHQRLIDELRQKTAKLNKESTQQDLLLSNQIASMGKIVKSQNVKIRELTAKLGEEAQLNRTNRIAIYVVGGVAVVSLVLTGWLSFVSVAA
jgi:hypothetical protein